MGSFAALAFTVALGHSTYLEKSNPEPHFKVELSKEDSPTYLWGQYEELSIRTLGQGLGDSSIFSFGIGARKTMGDFFVFGELGYGFIDEGAKDIIVHEVVYTELVRNHNVYRRPVPVDPKDYESVWEVDDGFLGSVGAGYEWANDWSATVSWRPFVATEHIEIYDVERKENGKGYWQETRGRDLSSFQMTIRYTF
jgi:hypothetical protein